MKTAHGVLRGSKIAGRHTTTTPRAAAVVVALKAEPCVVSIALGEIRQCGSRVERVKAQPINGGAMLKVYGNGAVQKLRVITNDVARCVAVAEAVR